MTTKMTGIGKVTGNKWRAWYKDERLGDFDTERAATAAVRAKMDAFSAHQCGSSTEKVSAN